MTCPSCGTPNEPGRKFCGECGTKLAAVCAACGTANPPTARFCGECGTALAAPAAGVAGPGGGQAVAASAMPGRRADRGTPTGHGAVRRPRRLHGVVRGSRPGGGARAAVAATSTSPREVIERYGGTVEKFIGDAVMAVWGAPVAHEDDAERAVRAALELVDAVRGARPRDPGPLRRAHRRGGGDARRDRPGHGRRRPRQHRHRACSRVAPAGRGPGRRVDPARDERRDRVRAGRRAARSRARSRRSRRGGRCASSPSGAGAAVTTASRRRSSAATTELRLLKDLFHATARERRVRLVSVTGSGGHRQEPPRVGVPEVPRRPRRERSSGTRAGRPPYGEGITFWALGEMVRSRAGLLETDDAATTRTRRSPRCSREYVPDEDERRRIEPALLALLGLGRRGSGGPTELFSAWRDLLRATRRRRASSCCCSRTSTGRTRARSTSSSTCSSGAATSRS